jgi:hypothetical protein
MKNYLFILIVSVLFASCEKEQPEEPLTLLSIEAGNYMNFSYTPKSMGVIVYVADKQQFMGHDGDTMQISHDLTQPISISVVNSWDNINENVYLKVSTKDTVLLDIKGKESIHFTGVLN